MSMTVEYCIDNAPTDCRREFPGQFEARPCMQLCGLCRRTPFVAVDGEVVTADDYAALLAAVATRADR